MITTTQTSAKAADALKLTVAGPEHEPLPAADVERLFGTRSPGAARLERLARWPRLIALCGAKPVGIVTYQGHASEVRAPDFGLDTGTGCDVDRIVGSILQGLEIAALAAGAKRVVVMPPRGGELAVLRRGYLAVHEGCAGSWVEKGIP